jgi:hypothetical protein
MMMASAFPEAQPARLTTSWSTALKSDVRWSGPAAPAAHEGGTHAADAVVRGLDEMLNAVDVNPLALSALCARTVRLAALVFFSSAWNWT